MDVIRHAVSFRMSRSPRNEANVQNCSDFCLSGHNNKASARDAVWQGDHHPSGAGFRFVPNEDAVARRLRSTVFARHSGRARAPARHFQADPNILQAVPTLPTVTGPSSVPKPTPAENESTVSRSRVLLSMLSRLKNQPQSSLFDQRMRPNPGMIEKAEPPQTLHRKFRINL